MRGEDPDGRHVVERIALDTSHRINRATPVTVTAVVCLAMLAADRALTLDGVLATVAPMAGYIAARRWPVAGAANLTDRATVRRTLQELVASGVLTSYDGGTDTVWRIRPASTWWPRSTATRPSTCWSTGRSGNCRWSPRPKAARRTAWLPRPTRRCGCGTC